MVSGQQARFCRTHLETAASSSNYAWDIAPEIAVKINLIGDGCGNFVSVASAGSDETVLYAHLMPGSLNSALHDGATVRAGDYLGRAGNSGAGSHPHLHIQCNARVAGSAYGEAARAMTWVHARAVKLEALGSDVEVAPWVQLIGRGVPTGNCAVWPSELPVAALRDAKLSQFTIASTGQVWAVRKPDGQVRLSSAPLQAQGWIGVHLDQNPGGAAKGVAVHGSQPYLIGTNDKVWEGQKARWAEIAGSPRVKRIATDAADGRLWCITTADEIMHFNPADRSWRLHPGDGRGRDICAHQGTAYVIGTDRQIYKSQQAGWTLLPGGGRGKRITVDAAGGRLWTIGDNDGIWKYLNTQVWEEHAGGGRAREIVIHARRPCVIGLADDTLWGSAGSAGWQRLNVVETA